MEEGPFETWETLFRGTGLFTTRDYKEGDLVLIVAPTNKKQPINFVNHSCNPNCKIWGWSVHAARDIEKGEEITIDYETIRWNAVKMEFQCLCGAENCREKISK